MFKHVFSTMNEALDEILREYPASFGDKKQALEEQLQVLRSMSDEFIESWLLFEERLGNLSSGGVQEGTQHLHEELLELDISGKQTAEFLMGQGYYKLFMYDQAIDQFEKLVRLQPDFLLARIYLAMGYLRKGDMGESYRHFQFLLPLTENTKMKAISYNAMGCIQAQNQNLEKAYEYFQKALSMDPFPLESFIQLDE
ncbi:tetratricopeptide repeat protein [Paenibacillus eucommiae]|uniref:Tetratricopeptide (TPR) repeat protein n=1 Tax=Paenibacillus eucommiae TaxID=1355755 RepID=A0ABS4J7M2_9BACL|nr:tetratricopeptide repeat protein [Paenibacillus eucommiae]MBP1994769.1 tetratricopeptide (TPR) repeat protein [Paenibacillus eucommiae]